MSDEMENICVRFPRITMSDEMGNICIMDTRWVSCKIKQIEIAIFKLKYNTV